MLEYFVKGGALMYPLLACSLLSLAVIVERAVQFIRTRDNPGALDRCEELIRRGDLPGAALLLERERGTTARFLAHALGEACARSGAGRDAQTLRVDLERQGDELLRRLGRGVHLLVLIERLAPLIGFLGTVVGMVLAFGRVASSEGPVKPSLIADGIWQALITTVAGLIVAIPALVASHFLTAAMRGRAERMRSLGEEVCAAVEKDSDARLP